MELRRLRYFVAVAEELSFNRAAQRLRISQPPLSTQIKQLEEELGVLLFKRSSRGVRMTDAGELLLEETRRIFIQLEQTARMVERIGSGKTGRLSLGFVPSATNEVLPSVLYEFQRGFPDVELFLHEMMPDQVVRRLHGRQIDVGFFYLPFDDSALTFRPVSREPLIVALSESHPSANEPEIDLRTLEREPFILPMRYEMPGLYGQVTEVCRQAGFTPRAVQKDVWLMQTIVGLVASGIGVALIPASLRNFRRKGVVYKTVRNLSPKVEMGMVWRRGDSSPVLSAFLDVVGEVAPLAKGKRASGEPVGLRTTVT
jgi:DNA-binding transcriptional LysR family regulator